MKLKDKVALVTGAGSGMGKAIALALAREGSDIIINYLTSQEGALKLAKEVEGMGRRALPIRADVAVKAEVQGMVNRATSILGKVDILINNAGTMLKRHPIAEMPEEVWDRVIDVNLKGAFLCTQAVAKGMMERRYGRIVNISSVGAFTGGGGGGSHYVAAKGGLIAFTRALAMELSEYNIRVNCIAPGVIDTPFHAKFSTPQAMVERTKRLPIGRPGRPEEIARAVLFLVDDECAYITGQTINIDGGMVFR